jgi:L-asparaginase/Glu-tRNA(Gln) amidotransferase subunit D
VPAARDERREFDLGATGKRLEAGELVARIPELGTIAQVEEIPFRRLPSQAITDRDLIDLARTIDRVFDENRADG